MMNTKLNERVLRMPQVCERTGKAKSSIYEEQARGTFPKAIRIGRRAVGWLESEVNQWIAERVAFDRKVGA